MSKGYCSVEDVERVLQKADITTSLDEDIIIDSILAQTEWVEKATRRHWYVPGGAEDDEHNLIFTDPKTRDDEHDVSTKAASIVQPDPQKGRIGRNRRTSDTVLENPRSGRRKREAHVQPRIAFGDRHDTNIPTYTRIRPERKDVTDVTELHVANEDGGFDDWVAESDIEVEVGSGLPSGQDAWIRINNEGVPELYLNIHTWDEEFGFPPMFSSCIYIELEYGSTNLTKGVRRGVASVAAASLVLDDETPINITDAGSLLNVETKSDHYRKQALGQDHSHLEPHLESSW